MYSFRWGNCTLQLLPKPALTREDAIIYINPAQIISYIDRSIDLKYIFFYRTFYAAITKSTTPEQYFVSLSRPEVSLELILSHSSSF